MTAAMQHEALVLPNPHDASPASNPATQSVTSPAFVGTSLASAFLYLASVGVITAIIPNALFARIVEPTVWNTFSG